jgi:hypothetical protein
MGQELRLCGCHLSVRDKIGEVLVVKARDKTEEAVARTGDRGGAGVVRAVFLWPLFTVVRHHGFIV